MLGTTQPHAVDTNQGCVPAGDQEGEVRIGRRRRQRRVLEKDRGQVPCQMIHAHHRSAERVAERLRGLDTDQERPHQTRTMRHRDTVQIVPPHSR